MEVNSAAHDLLQLVNQLCAPRVAPLPPPEDRQLQPPEDRQQGGKHEAAGKEEEGDDGGVGDDGAGRGWKVDAEGRGVYNSVLVNW